jgi:hypothetical protein
VKTTSQIAESERHTVEHHDREPVRGDAQSVGTAASTDKTAAARSMIDPYVFEELLKRAPPFDSIAHAVYWIRWHVGLTAVETYFTEPLIGYARKTEHIEMHLAEIYTLAQELFREQNSYGI